jgi:two-component system chemotaxis response regulator CheB
MDNKKKIRVMIVDDSAVIRKLLEKIFSSSPDIELVTGNIRI